MDGCIVSYHKFASTNVSNLGCQQAWKRNQKVWKFHCQWFKLLIRSFSGFIVFRPSSYYIGYLFGIIYGNDVLIVEQWQLSTNFQHTILWPKYRCVWVSRFVPSIFEFVVQVHVVWHLRCTEDLLFHFCFEPKILKKKKKIDSNHASIYQARAFLRNGSNLTLFDTLWLV